MCGIVGFINTRQNDLESICNDMVSKLHHRGPDYSSVWVNKEYRVALGHAREVLDASGDVLLKRLLGEIEHVRREQRLAVRGVVPLAGRQHAVDPRQQLLGAVVGVKDDRHAILGRQLAHVVRAGDGTRDRRIVVGVVEALACEG